MATTDPARARAFYEVVLGLRLLTADDYALVFDAHGTMLRITIVEHLTPAGYTVLGWRVRDIAATMRGLVAAGLSFERYPWFEQDQLGAWTAPEGSKVCWFKDPDGNTLSLTQPAEG